jgi:hypothetical protein
MEETNNVVFKGYKSYNNGTYKEQSNTSGILRILGGGRGLCQEFFFRGGVQQIQLRTEGRENGDLGVVAPIVGGSTQFANE